MLGVMTERRIGPALRALRRARRLRQIDVARSAGVAQSTVSDIERGRWRTVSIRSLERVFEGVGADFACSVRSRGSELERLLDERHAAVAMAVSHAMRSCRWRVEAEVSFNHYGDRGSIDLLCQHPPTRTVVVVEVKTEIASAEEMLRRLDIKARLTWRIAQDRFGERPERTVRLLAILDSTVNRARVARLAPLLAGSLPLRGAELRRWIVDPAPEVRGGVWFVRDIAHSDRTASPHRVRRPADGVRRPADRVRLPADRLPTAGRP